MDDIEKIVLPPLPYGLDDKIFEIHYCQEKEECDCVIEYESMNDQLKRLSDISGVNQDLMGPLEKRPPLQIQPDPKGSGESPIT